MVLEGITVDEASILRIQGYRDLTKIRPVIRRVATSVAREAEQLFKPQVYYCTQGVMACEGSLLKLADGTTFENEAFQRLLKDPQYIAAFVLTMGSALDDAVVHCISADELLRALFLETAGWLGIEAVTRSLAIQLRQEAKKHGLRLSPRLGPGYSYKLNGRSVLWPLEQQQTLFRLFANDEINVQLLDSCAMIPKISRSGIFGFLPMS